MKKFYFLFSAIIVLAAGTVSAQYTVLHSFDSVQGAYPSSTLTLIGKTLFGVTYKGSTHDSGCIFSVDTMGNNYRVIHSFSRINSNGANPLWLTFQISGSKLFGTTTYGGAHDSGTVFSIDTSGTNYKDLLDFNGPNGSQPQAGVTLSGKMLYGLTYLGGANQYGVVYVIDTNGTGYRKLHDFTGTDGSYPDGVVTIIRNKLYGDASYGGANNDGVVFSLDTNGSNYRDIFDFSAGTGNTPNNSLIPSRNKLFGMTYQGGAHGLGNVFSIDTTGAGFRDLLDFNGLATPYGANPFGDVILKNGVLYGMTSAGGISGDGCIFSLDSNGTNYTYLHDFVGTDGAYPYANVTFAGNTMFGTTQGGGANNYGVVFKMTISSPTGVNELSYISTARVYPNPNNGLFSVRLSAASGQKSAIEIYNMLGENVYSQFSIPGAQYQIDLSTEPAGIYEYRILSSSGDLISNGKLSIVK